MTPVPTCKFTLIDGRTDEILGPDSEFFYLTIYYKINEMVNPN